MAATPYRPVSFTSESVSQAKLQQMANNDQWLFENSARVRYSGNNIVRDSSLKIMAGKAYFAPVGRDHIDVPVYFGNFFSAGCQPIVSVTVQTGNGWLRKIATVRSHQGTGGVIDHTGFVAHVTSHEPPGVSQNIAGGWLHWMAVGY